MQRFPEGIDGEGFYHKRLPEYFPPWVSRVEVPLQDGGSQEQVVVKNAATLVYLADQACITPHVWMSRAGSLQRPDRLVFDLDPPDGDFSRVKEAARLLGRLLEDLGLAAFIMTTGSRGLHVVSPLDQSSDFDSVRGFAGGVARVMERRHPRAVTTEMRKKERRGRLFLDYLRNAYGQTTVPPYGVRPLPEAPVAAPLAWEELGNSALSSRSYTVRNIFRRLARKEDPWKGMGRRARSLDGPGKLLHSLEEQTRR
jgi:bifunctional non-homologous end joining protein LigD